MSPEQAGGERDLIGPPTDVYALGVMLYELLCREAPFDRPNMSATLAAVCHENVTRLRRHRPTVPRDLEAVCLKCLAKEPSIRYHSAAELRDDLMRLLSNQPTIARPLTGAERLSRWAKRKPAMAGLVVMTGFSIVGLIVGLTLYSGVVTRHSEAIEAALVASGRSSN